MINSKLGPVKTHSRISKLEDNSKFQTLRFLRVSALSASCGGSAVEVTIREDTIIIELEVKRELSVTNASGSCFSSRIFRSRVCAPNVNSACMQQAHARIAAAHAYSIIVCKLATYRLRYVPYHSISRVLFRVCVDT